MSCCGISHGHDHSSHGGIPVEYTLYMVDATAGYNIALAYSIRVDSLMHHDFSPNLTEVMVDGAVARGVEKVKVVGVSGRKPVIVNSAVTVHVQLLGIRVMKPDDHTVVARCNRGHVQLLGRPNSNR